MIPRYTKKAIKDIFDPLARLLRFDRVEAAGVRAEEKRHVLPEGSADRLAAELKAHPPDEERRKLIEKTTDHDFMAYVMQRWEILTNVMEKIFHRGKTTFDIQDPADQIALLQALDVVEQKLLVLMEVVRSQALKYRYLLLLAKTHGQGAQITTFGKRLASYYADLESALHFIRFAKEYIRFGKMSDMIGDYQNTSPEAEAFALDYLGLKPYYGATQILPRLIHAILASSLTVLDGVLAKIAEDYQLMARSPNPLIQEPFKEGQIGSSANPAKKNSIKSEQTVGMFRLALGNLMALFQNLITKEERDIAQSSVERVALIDQFHIAVNALDTMTRLMAEMVVYPDRMYQQITDMRGTESAEAAKEALAMHGLDWGITREEAYNIVKLASHMVIYPDELEADLRANLPKDIPAAIKDLGRVANRELKKPPHIKEIIEAGSLRTLPTLKIASEEVAKWNERLPLMMQDPAFKKEWDNAFSIERMLAGQQILFEKLERGWMNFPPVANI